MAFINPVSTKEHPRINEWLGQVEHQMRVSLATGMAKAVESIRKMTDGGELETTPFMQWLDQYPTQIIVLAAQVLWSEQVEDVLAKGGEVQDGLHKVLKIIENMVTTLANSVLQEQPALRRKKIENLIIEYVHKRAILRSLIKSKVDTDIEG